MSRLIRWFPSFTLCCCILSGCTSSEGPVAPTGPCRPVLQGSHSIAEPPVLLRLNAPEYPPEAIEQGHQGLVRVLVTIGEDGLVCRADIFDGPGYPELDESALKVARTSVWSPAISRQGWPCATVVVVPFRFSIGRPDGGRSDARTHGPPHSALASRSTRTRSRSFNPRELNTSTRQPSKS